MPPYRFAACLMITQAVLFTAETAAVHQIGSRLSVMQLALLRGAGGVVLALCLAGKFGVAVLRTRPMRGKMFVMALAWLSAVREVIASSAKICSKPRS